MKWFIVVMCQILFWIVAICYFEAHKSFFEYGFFWVVAVLSGVGMCFLLGIHKD